MWVVEHTMPLITCSKLGAESAHLQHPLVMRPHNPAMFNQQTMAADLEMDEPSQFQR